MKKLIERTIIILLLILIFFNNIFPQFAYASIGGFSEEYLNYFQIDDEKIIEIKNNNGAYVPSSNAELCAILLYSLEKNLPIDNIDKSRILDSQDEKNRYTKKVKKLIDNGYADLDNYIDNVWEDYKKEIFNRIDIQYVNNSVPQEIDNQQIKKLDPLVNFGGWILDGLLGIALYPIKLLFLIPAVLVKIITGVFALGTAGHTNLFQVNLYTVFFNKIEILKINLFEQSSDETLNGIRNTIAEFYYVFRNIAIAFSLAVLIYIGIRMAMNNVGEARAKYQKWLVNWFVGFGLIFVLHFIIIITINANTMLVENILDKSVQAANLDNIMLNLMAQSWWIPLTTSFGSTAMYVGLVIISFVFFIIYIKRMITIAFLIIIAPLICVTYSIDKIGNNKSEVLNTWLREFLYNVLIQPFHCVIYLIFIGEAMNLLLNSGSLNFGTMMYAMIFTFSIFFFQKIIREIFGFGQSSSLTEKVAIFALAHSTISNVKAIGAIRKARNDTKANKAEQKFERLPDQMPGGEEVNGNELVQLRMDAEKQRTYEQASQKAKDAGQPIPSKPKEPELRKRRLKKKPALIRFYGRVYKDVIGRATGYNLLKKARIKRRKRKHAFNKMNDRDVVIAIGESYRQAKDPNMTTQELATAFDRINSADITSLEDKDLSFRLMMEAAEMQFNMSKSEIRDALLHGSGSNWKNKRWKK